MRLKKLLAAAALAALALFPSAAQTPERPMVMPAAQPAGPATWLFGGAYGNTPGAFNNADEWYRAGQGLHFGVDLSMPCGTELIAVADGVVAFVDDLGFGAGPHNIILRHDALGVTTLYGHTSPERIVQQGQVVAQGDHIGYSGDPDSTCFSRPHLHFEVRSLDYQTTYNPVDWIDANWHTLALVGAFSDRMFQGDMDNPSRWMSLEDQPDVRFFGARLNNYSAVYPPARGQGGPASAPPHRELPPLDTAAPWTARMIGSGGCCWQNFWHPADPDGLYSIEGMSGQRAQVVRWSLDGPSLDTPVETAPPSQKSPDWTWRIELQGSEAILRNTDLGTEFRYNTGGQMPSLSTDNSRLLWIDTRPTAPGQPRSPATVIVAELASGAVSTVYEAPGASAQWIDGARLLFTTPGDNRATTYSVFDTRDGSLFGLGTWAWSRGANVGPGGDWLILYVTYQPDPADSGVYAIRTLAGAQPVKLPWFGSWRWRDSNELYVIPMDVTTSTHTLHHFDLETGAMTPLNTPPFSVMNGEWAVNADGTKIAYRELTTNELTLLEISE